MQVKKVGIGFLALALSVGVASFATAKMGSGGSARMAGGAAIHAPGTMNHAMTGATANHAPGTMPHAMTGTTANHAPGTMPHAMTGTTANHAPGRMPH